MDYEEYIKNENGIVLSEWKQRVILSRLYGEKKKTLKQCPQDIDKPCCEYCPVKRSGKGRNCDEIHSCMDLFTEIARENAYLKEQLELERWRLGQIKEMFDNPEHAKIRKLVLSYAGLYDAETEAVRLKKIAEAEKQAAEKKEKACLKIQEELPKPKVPSGVLAPYFYFDADGKLHKEMVAEELAEELKDLDRREYNSNKKYDSKLVNFGFDPFSTDFIDYGGEVDEGAIDFHGSIFGSGSLEQEHHENAIKQLQETNESFNRYRKNQARRQLRQILKNDNMADSYYFFVYEGESKASIARRLNITDVMVGKYINRAKEVEAEYGLDKLGISDREEKDFIEFIANFKKEFGIE
jgi:hypothetical protein